MSHHPYLRRNGGEATDRWKPSDNVSRSRMAHKAIGRDRNREGRVSLPASRRQGAKVDGMASIRELSINVVNHKRPKVLGRSQTTMQRALGL